MVATTYRFERLLADLEEDEKKKVPARVPFVWQISAIEPKMAVFPDRSGPVSHKILMG